MYLWSVIAENAPVKTWATLRRAQERTWVPSVAAVHPNYRHPASHCHSGTVEERAATEQIKKLVFLCVGFLLKCVYLRWRFRKHDVYTCTTLKSNKITKDDVWCSQLVKLFHKRNIKHCDKNLLQRVIIYFGSYSLAYNYYNIKRLKTIHFVLNVVWKSQLI